MQKRISPFVIDSRDLVEVLRAPPQGSRFQAVVSSDDNYLSAGGGVSLALRDAGGAAFAQEIERHTLAFQNGRSNIALGDVVATSAGSLPVRHVFHVISIDLDRGIVLDLAALRRTADTALSTANSLGVRSLALPLPATGVSGLDRVEVAKVLASSWRRISASTSLRRLVVSTGPDCSPDEREEIRFVLESAGIDLLGLLNREPEAWEDLLTWAGPRFGVEAEVREVAPRDWQTLVPRLCDELFELLENTGASVDLMELLERAWRSVSGTDRLPQFEGSTEAVAGTPAREPPALHPRFQAGLSAWLGRQQRTPKGRWRESFNEDPDSLVIRTERVVPGDQIKLRGEPEPRVILRVVGDKRRRALSDGSLPFPTGTVQWRIPRERSKPPERVSDVNELPALVAAMPALACEAPATYHEFAASADSREEATPSGVDPISRLARFLMSLPADRTRFLIDSGRDQGHVGSDEAVVQELCLARSPLELIEEVCIRHDLVVALEIHKLEVDGSKSDLARRMCAHYGFTLPRPIHGPHQIAAELQAAHHDVHVTVSVPDAKSAATNGARSLERAIKMILRFQAEYLFQKQIDLLIRERQWTNPIRTIADSPLGALVAALDKMAKSIGPDSDDAAAPKYAARYGNRPLVPETVPLAELARLRNLFAHDRTEEPTLSDARRFLGLAQALVDHWRSGEPPLLPPVVKVNSTHTDEWGRTRLETITDSGRIESIYNGQPLEPGQHYFMLAHSNPIRVFPVLVPAHDSGV